MVKTKQVELTEEYETGFPFGKTTIKEIFRKVALHNKKTFSEVFEFYTDEYAEKAIKEIIAQAQQEAEQRVRDEVWSMVMTHTDIFDKYPSLKRIYLQQEQR